MAETSSYVPWAYEERTGPIDNTTKPQRHLPWSHLTKEEFVRCKKTYTKYWYENLSTHNFARVFGELTYRVNYETGACFPSRASIAKRLRISEKTVQRAIKALEDHGLIQVRRTSDLIRSQDGFLTQGVGRSNVYTIRFEKTMYWDENGLPVIDVDEDLDCLTLCGRRRLPPWHLWYNCETFTDDAKLPLLAPPCPAIDAEVPAVDPPADPAVSTECPTKGKEGYEGYEGREGKEGTEVPATRGVAGRTSLNSLSLQDATKPAEDVPALSENKILSAVDASQKTESALRDYGPAPLKSLQQMRDAERRDREAVAKREQKALYRAWSQQIASRPPSPEIPLVQEEEPLVD